MFRRVYIFVTQSLALFVALDFIYKIIMYSDDDPYVLPVCGVISILFVASFIALFSPKVRSDNGLLAMFSIFVYLFVAGIIVWDIFNIIPPFEIS